MQNPKSRILQKNRLRPQKKGKLPNFTRDFENCQQKICQLVKSKLQFSFQINKFGVQKRDIIFNLKKKIPVEERLFKVNLNSSNIQLGGHTNNGCQKYLKFNETKIMPDHKIHIHKKSPKKVKKQNSEPSISKTQNIRSTDMNQLPKINFTSRQMPVVKSSLFSRQNLYDTKTVRLPIHQSNEKNKNYIRLYHILTMGRKQILS